MSKSRQKIEQMAQEPDKWIRYMQIRCRECDGCGERWEWIPSMGKNKIPVMKVDGVCLGVRPAIYRLAKGIAVQKSRGVITNCQNSKCINPSLLVQLTKSQIVEKAARSGRLNSVVNSIKRSAARRATSKLSQESVRDIMTRQEKAEFYAEKYGITSAYVRMIWQGLYRKEYGGPFSGLLAA